jgi:WD40 repeat protein
VAPTQQVGLQIEQKLVYEMLADVKGALGSLPLLQFALTELWKKCATHRLLTFSAYEALGKIAGTLEKGANGVYEKLSPAEQKTAKLIFIELTQLGEGTTPDTRRQLSQQDLVTSVPFESAPVGEVIQKLVDANLVVTDKPKEEVAIVNIAHEALTQHWGKLRGWLDDNRDAIKIQRDIEADAKKWQGSEQSKNALLQGLNLNIAKDYAKTHTEKVPLSTLALDFVQRSVKRQRHYWQGVVGSVVGIILVLAGIAFYAEEQKNNALRGQSLLLADLAQQETEKGNAVNGILLALAALPKDISNPDRPYVIEAEVQLYHALFQQRELRTFLGHEDTVTGVKINFDGNRIVTVSNDGTVRLWDTHSGELITLFNMSHEKDDYNTSTIFIPNGECIAVEYSSTTYLWNINNSNLLSLQKNNRVIISHDGQRMITIKKGVARVWDNNCKPIMVFKDKIKNAAFSLDNQHMITISNNNVIHLWKMNSKQQIATLFMENKTDFIAISPNFQNIATFDYGVVHLWNIITNEKLLDISAFSTTGNVVTFCSDKQHILTEKEGADGPDSIHFWDINNGKQVSILDFISTYNYSFTIYAVSPDCQKIFTATGGSVYANNEDHSVVHLWNIPNSKHIASLRGHENTIYSIDLSQDGQYVVTGSADNTARLWSLKNNNLITVIEEVEKMDRTAFNQHNKNAFTISENGTIQKINSGKQIAVLEKYSKEDQATDIIFSPDKQYVITDSPEGGIARLWQVKSSQLIATISKNSAGKTVFSPDSKYGATLTFEGYHSGGVILLWKVSNGEEITTIYKHDGATDVAFSPNGKRIAIGYLRNGIAELWDIDKLKPIATIQAKDKNWINSISFSSDGQKILTDHGDTANIWRIFPTTQALIDYAREIVPRQLTTEQRKQFFLE